jgi:hypothetical protein
MTEEEKDKFELLMKKYELLISARNFHYDNFNKWMTYFYVAIGALFVGYCTILTSQKMIDVFHQTLVIFMGFLVSIFWYWSAKGYYYWNISFINLVNYYEKDLLKFDKKERVYFVFANRNSQNNYLSPISGANISTSKVAILFAFLICLFWGSLLYKNILDLYWGEPNHHFLLAILISFTTILILSFIIPKRFLKSNNNHFPDLKITT